MFRSFCLLVAAAIPAIAVASLPPQRSAARELVYTFTVDANLPDTLTLSRFVRDDLDDAWRGVDVVVEAEFVPSRPVTGYAAAVFESFTRLQPNESSLNQVGSLSSTVGGAGRDGLPVSSITSTTLLWEGLSTSWNDTLVLDVVNTETYGFDAGGDLDGVWRVTVTLLPILD